MKIIKYLKKKNDLYQLFLDNGEVLEVYSDVILNNNLLIIKDISLELYSKIEYENSIYKCYNDCLKYMKSRLRSKYEMVKYLEKNKILEKDLLRVIDMLENNGLIDDVYFCKCFISDKLKFSSMGEYKIIYELKKLGISDEIINKCYYLFDNDLIYEKIIKLIEKYIKSNKKKSGFVLKNKIYNNLMNQGYSKDMILDCLNEYNFDV